VWTINEGKVWPGMEARLSHPFAPEEMKTPVVIAIRRLTMKQTLMQA